MNKYDIVAFDLDSTLVKIEGLDFLAEQSGNGKEVRDLTMQAMEGMILAEVAFEQKMALIRPSRKDLEQLAEIYYKQLVRGAKEVIEKLHQRGIEVWIVTGNFNPAPQLLAEKLGIPKERVFSNQTFFNEDGSYQGFDREVPLYKNGGKGKIVEKYKGSKSIAFVGDAKTDLETKGIVDFFIGYGGVVERQTVKDNADVYVKDPNLLCLLPYLLHEESLA